MGNRRSQLRIAFLDKFKDPVCVGVHGLLYNHSHVCGIFSKHPVGQKAYNWINQKLEFFQMTEAKG